jgi:hypothetical protein
MTKLGKVKAPKARKAAKVKAPKARKMPKASRSRSYAGTKKTSSFIKHLSPKKIDRSDLGRTKFGSGGKQASHILGFGLVNAIMTHLPGKPAGEEKRKKIVRALNSSKNLRVKSSHSNQVVDERRDARISHSFVNGAPLVGKSTAKRAYQVHASAMNHPALAPIAKALGEMKVDGHKLKNHGNYVTDLTGE